MSILKKILNWFLGDKKLKDPYYLYLQVATYANLPTVGDYVGQSAICLDTQRVYIWNGSIWKYSHSEASGGQGAKGDKGDKGDTGAQGIQGVQGVKGDQGEQGIQGLQGVKGDKGDTGEQGIQGLKGDKGDKGDDGEQGIQGIQGLKGDKGDTGLQGIQGVKGDKGDTGDTGLQGIQGLKGDKGNTGDQGIQGLKGDKGDTGAPGSSHITTNPQTDDYSLQLTDDGLLIEMNKGTAVNLTVPLNASVAFVIGTTIGIIQKGVGQVTIVATGGVTINSKNGLKLSGQYAGATLTKVGTDLWYLNGDTTA